MRCMEMREERDIRWDEVSFSLSLSQQSIFHTSSLAAKHNNTHNLHKYYICSQTPQITQPANSIPISQNAYHAQNPPNNHPRRAQVNNTHNPLHRAPIPEIPHHGSQAHNARSPRNNHYNHHYHQDNAHHWCSPSRSRDCRACSSPQASRNHGRQGFWCADEVEGNFDA
jgi:hypothetical protein